ncbi:tetratricopeptide repeat protein [Vaginisenegalia massiliensis]|uniref:tetratricopeptide repeat protein n=1 Tax=Vaginisenegalia massiliensis TaxID=2058294 RepID=UPI000F544D59|nr:tetratricopeptide repeat protein [Vaginisenegalia massiliensis]
MSDIYNLPNKAEAYSRKGNTSLQTGDYPQALEYFQKSYQIEKNPEIFKELVSLHLLLGHEQELAELWQKEFPDEMAILADADLAHDYAYSLTKILPSQEALLKLYQLKDQVSHQAGLQDLFRGLIRQLNEQINFEQAIKQVDTLEQAHQIITKLREESPFNLLSRIKRLYRLDMDSSLLLYLAILETPTIGNYIKTDVLHHLILNNYSEIVKLLWFGQERQVNLSDLSPYRQLPIYQNLMADVDSYCQEQNPHLLNELKNQLTLQALEFYPFIDEVVTDDQLWLQAFLYQIGLTSDFHSQENARLLSYIDKANLDILDTLG